MALVIADRVKETSTTTGTGVLTLAGAPSGFVTFASKCAVGDTVFYIVEHQSANEWECGKGTYSAANQLTRTTVLAGTNGASAVNFSAGTKNVFVSAPAAQMKWVREPITSARDYYVAKTGSDSNDGLTSGTAFLTVQKAVNTVCDTLSINAGGSVIIHVAAGTYTEDLSLRPFVGSAVVDILITGASTATVSLSPTGNCVYARGVNARYQLTGVSLPHGIRVLEGAYVQLQEILFNGTVDYPNAYCERSFLEFYGPITVSGAAFAHVISSINGYVFYGAELTLSGTPSFDTAFLVADYGGKIFIDGAGITGIATGVRYVAESAGIIVAGANDPLPGNSAGTAATGGAYY